MKNLYGQISFIPVTVIIFTNGIVSNFSQFLDNFAFEQKALPTKPVKITFSILIVLVQTI